MKKIRQAMPPPKRRNKVQEALVIANKKAGAHTDNRAKIISGIVYEDMEDEVRFDEEE